MNTSLLHKLRKHQINQRFENFKGTKVDDDDFKRWPLLPNQFAYLIDCSKSEVSAVNGALKPLTGIDKNEISTDHIYDIMSGDVLADFLGVVRDGFEVIKNTPTGTLPFRNGLSHICALKKVGGANYTFHRMAWIWEGDAQGLFTKTISIYTLLHKGKYQESNPMMVGPEGNLFRASHLEPFINLLSTRELDVLKLISQGYKAGQIADVLCISKFTVDTHRKNMINKLEANSTPHLVALAKDMGLI